jgi:opacity protein-like surface antigen
VEPPLLLFVAKQLLRKNKGRFTPMKGFAFASCIALFTVVTANAQETPKFSFDIGAGFTSPVGGTGAQVDTGWNVGLGVGYNFSAALGAKLDLDYSSMGITSSVLQNIGVPGGGVHIFSATVDPIVHLTPHRHFDAYVTGGGGLFHLNQDFTQPTVAVTNVFDPFFGIYPVAFGAQQILSSYSVNKPGFDVGAGLAFGAWGHGKFFAEAKWDHMFMANSHADYVPVKFGFRW